MVIGYLKSPGKTSLRGSHSKVASLWEHPYKSWTALAEIFNISFFWPPDGCMVFGISGRGFLGREGSYTKVATLRLLNWITISDLQVHKSRSEAEPTGSCPAMILRWFVVVYAAFVYKSWQDLNQQIRIFVILFEVLSKNWHTNAYGIHLKIMARFRWFRWLCNRRSSNNFNRNTKRRTTRKYDYARSHRKIHIRDGNGSCIDCST